MDDDANQFNVEQGSEDFPELNSSHGAGRSNLQTLLSPLRILIFSPTTVFLI